MNDYGLVDMALPFIFTSNETCIQVNITEDDVLESNEVFQLQLTSDDRVVILPIPAVNVTIIDNDGKNKC